MLEQRWHSVPPTNITLTFHSALRNNEPTRCSPSRDLGVVYFIFAEANFDAEKTLWVW